ncbi:MAG: ribonuclease III [Pseudomonadaceae bacterium]|nr:ribonuclease III [Pseudomonadaceae bacterium]
MPDKAAVQWCEQVLGHRFADSALLAQALTHGSTGHKPTYERLEFLGDRVLGLVVAEMLYKAFPDANEGEMGRRHAALVQGSLLAEMAETWGLAAHLRMGGDTAPTTGILADVVEAVLGAVYLDGGLDAAARVIGCFWHDKLPVLDGYDAKTRLQELLQAQKLPTPQYEVVESLGPDHAREFTVEARCTLGAARGRGPSKQAASMAAAAELLKVVEVGHG